MLIPQAKPSTGAQALTMEMSVCRSVADYATFLLFIFAIKNTIAPITRIIAEI